MITILVLEDEQEILNNIKTILTFNNFNVITFTRSTDALEYLANNNVDLILCDIMMPGINGFEFLSKFNELKNSDPTPFIFLTAKTNLQDIRKGMNLGADDYITKPFTAADLLTSIGLRLKRYGKILSKTDNQTGDVKKTLVYDDTVILPYQGQYKPIEVSSIFFIKADDVYSEVHTCNGNKYYMRKLLKEWESLLPSKQFQRIHKSVIINLKKINKIEKWSNNSLAVFLENHTDYFIVSRKYAKELKDKYFL